MKCFVLVVVFVLAACHASGQPRTPTITPLDSPLTSTSTDPSPVVASPQTLPEPTCTGHFVASGLYEATIEGLLPGAPRRNGEGGRGIDIDLLLDATSDGRAYPILFSVWDPDGETGPEGRHFLFGPRDGSSILVDSGRTPDNGRATIAADGSAADFDVHLQLGTVLTGSVQCPGLT
jgi:hypothetical protein